MIDLHVHTSRCGHAEGAVAEYAAAAAAAGVRTMAFCDHLPLPAGYPSGYAMAWRELPDYVSEVRALAAECVTSGGPEVLLGVEADWIPRHEGMVAEALDAYPFDIVLGSVHFIDDWAFDDPDLRARYAEWTPDRLWKRYFDDLSRACASGLFDVMAHPDLVKKFGDRPAHGLRVWYEATADAFASAGVAVEVNSAGLRKPCAEIYPALGLLRACRAAGVPATTGSDAHTPADVGRDLSAARHLLREAGYDSIMVFRGRVAEEVGL